MISLGLILLGFFLRITLNIISLKYESSITHSICLVGVIQIAGSLIFSLPFVLLDIFEELGWQLSGVNVMLIWLFLSLLLILLLFLIAIPLVDKSFLFGKESSKQMDLVSFKAFSSLPALLFISTFSLMNFSFCLFCGILMVPVTMIWWTTIQPTPTTKLSFWMQLLLLLILSPVPLGLSASLYLNINMLQLLATIVEQYRLFRNLLFPFLSLIYLPITLSFLKVLTSWQINVQ